MRFLLTWCAAALTMCLAVAADSLLPGGPRLPGEVIVVCFFAVIPAFIGMYVVIWSHFGTPRLGQVGRRWRTQFLPAWQASPLAARVATIAIVVIAMTNFLLSTTAGTPGQPEIVNGTYVLNSHGVLTPVSAEAYRHALAESQRLFALHASIFISVSATMVLGVRALRRQNGQ